MDNLYKTMDEMAMRYAQATGHLQGILISMALYDDITPSQFKFIYSALERSTELASNAMSDFDRERLHKRAGEIGVTI
jgi:hypothetical protein